MNRAIDEVGNNSKVRSAVLMSAEPGMFCAGADLKERINYTDEQIIETVKELRATFHRIYVSFLLFRKFQCLPWLV